ncbi:Sugar phosphate isomerase/epimerase [Prosthecobacter debontii]|uniref:Sugar phosphate isomerase/epimerase n=1 Tax=Prosthecobacter debontii TaxID=48467 RepID=A0A1T4WY13_9BACT|nr:sugar phosphate isomerase/epimerase family protein [Prosthecobacter debontii]SKA82240.1 Sugar phosphate isomerase/epimerase [Prosthecobacter debontii]
MNQWPIGLSTGCFYYRSIFDVLEGIAESGFRQIEICSYPRHLDYHQHDLVARAGERMRELELHPFSFHAPFADRIDITSLNDHTRQDAVKELCIACEAAAAMGAKNVVLHPGPEREGRPPQEEFLLHMEVAAESLNVVAQKCHQLGVNLLLENMLPHLLFGHISDMLYLLGQIQECNVGTCLDTGHACLARELGTVVHKLSGHLKMIHANDNRGDYDSHLNPGEGIIDWPWLLGELKGHQFKGSMILELTGNPYESITDTLARARRAFDYLVGVSKNN